MTLLNIWHWLSHLDQSLITVFHSMGYGLYALLFAIIFCETGLVVTPFLPGDSLLFAAGSLAASQHLSFFYLLIILLSAAILGDQTNYGISRVIGYSLIKHHVDRWYFRRKYVDRAHAFYESYGGKTLIIARFVPIVRTFAPFVAGLAKMTYLRFCLFSMSGGVLWVGLLTGAGFLFGTMPVVQQHFTLVILAVIVLSLIPGVIDYFRKK